MLPPQTATSTAASALVISQSMMPVFQIGRLPRPNAAPATPPCRRPRFPRAGPMRPQSPRAGTLRRRALCRDDYRDGQRRTAVDQLNDRIVDGPRHLTCRFVSRFGWHALNFRQRACSSGSPRPSRPASRLAPQDVPTLLHFQRLVLQRHCGADARRGENRIGDGRGNAHDRRLAGSG